MLVCASDRHENYIEDRWDCIRGRGILQSKTYHTIRTGISSSPTLPFIW